MNSVKKYRFIKKMFRTEVSDKIKSVSQEIVGTVLNDSMKVGSNLTIRTENDSVFCSTKIENIEGNEITTAASVWEFSEVAAEPAAA